MVMRPVPASEPDPDSPAGRLIRELKARPSTGGAVTTRQLTTQFKQLYEQSMAKGRYRTAVRAVESLARLHRAYANPDRYTYKGIPTKGPFG